MSYCPVHYKVSPNRWCITHGEFHRICCWTSGCKSIFEEHHPICPGCKKEMERIGDCLFRPHPDYIESHPDFVKIIKSFYVCWDCRITKAVVWKWL